MSTLLDENLGAKIHQPVLYRPDGPRERNVTMEHLEPRITSFLERNFSAPSERLAALARSILSAYGSPERRYHDQRHLKHCLAELDDIDANNLDRPAIELAIWYHDLVYVPGRTDNEAQSAQRLLDDLSGLETPIDLEKVRRMILASTHSGAAASDQDTSTFLDVDLSILGQDEITYESYQKGVRAEYRRVPEFLYRRKRNNVLRRLLSQPIYRTEWFSKRYEALARQNLQRELAGPIGARARSIVGVPLSVVRSEGKWWLKYRGQKFDIRDPDLTGHVRRFGPLTRLTLKLNDRNLDFWYFAWAFFLFSKLDPTYDMLDAEGDDIACYLANRRK